MAPDAAAAAPPHGPGADRPALEDDLAALAAALEEIALYDREIDELRGSRDEAVERRDLLNLRVSPFFRGLPQPSVVAGRGGALFCLHQGVVRPLPRYSAAAAEALGLCPAPGRPAHLPRGWKMVADPPGPGPGPGPGGPRHGDRPDSPPAAHACTDLDAIDAEVS